MKSLPDRYKGSIQTHTWNLSGQMTRMGHEVSILSAGSLLHRERRDEVDGRTVIQIPYMPGRHIPAISKMAEEWGFNVAAHAWLMEHYEEYDLIHLEGRSGFFFPGQQNKVPVVTTLHGLISVENARSGYRQKSDLNQRMHESWATRWEASAIQKSDRLIVVSQEMVEQLRSAGYNMGRLTPKITQIYNGVLPAPPPGDIKTDPNTLLFLGRLERIKGIFPLVEAMKKVRPSVRLVMLGEGSDRPALEHAIAEAGLKERVKLTGALKPALVYQWLHHAAFLVAPSLHESHGIAPLEAMSCGKAVVTTDIRGMQESVRLGENGLMVAPNNPGELAQVVEWLLDRPDEAARMGAAGREMVSERFSWETIAKQTESVYELALYEKKSATDFFMAESLVAV